MQNYIELLIDEIPEPSASRKTTTTIEMGE